MRNLPNPFDIFENVMLNSYKYLPESVKPLVPYNLYKDSNDDLVYEIAVAGYKKEDLQVKAQEGLLTVKGKAKENKNVSLLYKGLTSKDLDFYIPYTTAYMVKQVELEDGILKITFSRNEEVVKLLDIKTKETV